MPHDCRMWRRVPSYCIWRPLHVAVREGLWGISQWGHSLARTEDYGTPGAGPPGQATCQAMITRCELTCCCQEC